jgi:hypothetical protein
MSRVFQHLRCHSAQSSFSLWTFIRSTYFFFYIAPGGGGGERYGGYIGGVRKPRDWLLLSSPFHWFGNSLSGPSVEEHHLVERKCLIEDVLWAGLQITLA